MAITRSQALARIAGIIAERSTCSRGSVGCIIAREGRIIATGYNGAPSGLPHCEHECTCSDPGMNVLLRENEGCSQHDPKMHCQLALHAEANALVFAARHGVMTEGAELWTTRAPCLNCAGLIVNAGIATVVVGEPHTDDLGMYFLHSLMAKRRMVVRDFPQ